MQYTLDMDIRKLHPADIEGLSRILQQSDSWRKLMAIVKNEDKENKELLFNGDHVSMIENGSRLVQKTASEVFLEEWSVMGKKRPTCRILLNYLVEADLFRAADHLAVKILKIDPPERPGFGPAAKIDINDKILGEMLMRQAQFNGAPRSSQPVTWSLNYQESSVELLVNKPKTNTEMSDLMKFSQTKSNAIELSTASLKNNDDDGFVLQVADSQDIPCFVLNKVPTKNEDNDKIDLDDSNSEEVNTTSSSVITDVAQPSIENSVVNADSYDNCCGDVPIPVLVLERHEKDER